MKIRKPVFAFLILLLLSAVFAVIISVVFSYEINQQNKSRNELKMTSIGKTLEIVEGSFTSVYNGFFRKTDTAADLTALLLREKAGEKEFDGMYILEDGFMVEVNGDQIIYPEGVKPIAGLQASDVENEISQVIYKMPDKKGSLDSFFVTARQIKGNYYYVDTTPCNDLTETVYDASRTNDTILGIEKTYGCRLLVVSLPSGERLNAEEGQGSIDFVIRPWDLGDDIRPEMIGITAEIIEQKPFSFDYNGKSYLSNFRQIKLFGSPTMVIVLTPMENFAVNMFYSMCQVTGLIFVICMCVIMWLYWTQAYVRDNELLSSQVPLYKPSRIRKQVIALTVIGSIGLFLFVSIYQLLTNLSQEAESNRKALEIVSSRLEENENTEAVSALRKDEEEWAAYYTERIAAITGDNALEYTLEFLNEVKEMTGCKYIMLFDENGKEIISSNGLIGYSLTETEPLREFAELLKGVSPKTGKPVTDLSGKDLVQFFGAPFVMESKDVYGVVIMANDVADSWQTTEKRIFREYLENATPEGNLCVVLDKEKHTVVYSSNPELIGISLPDLALKKDGLEESDLDIHVIDNIRYYGAYNTTEKYIVYYLTVDEYVPGNSLLFAVFSMVGYLIIIWLISMFMLKPYTKDAYNAAVRIKDSTSVSEIVEKGSLDNFFERNDSEEPLNLKQRWRALIPEQKTQLFVQVILGILLLVILVPMLNGKYAQANSSRSTINFILFGNWKRGLNLLGVAGAILIILSFVIFMFFKDILLRILCMVLGPKGKTICRLAFSLLQYGAVLGGIYLILGFFGLNTTFQLTSVGIVQLAISLGSKDIVADILAGIFIIFEEDFKVGDYVDINGFSGIVQEIGVRSTKVLGLGDNIKIFSNQNVKNVLNMSKHNTWVTLDVKIAAKSPLLEVEKLLEKELPEIGERIPEIISGPYYKGVWSADGWGKVLHISFECTEQHARVARRKLYHEVIVLLESNDCSFA